MKSALALFALGFGSLVVLAQEPGDPPIKVAPPVIEEIAPRPDSPPKRMPPTEALPSQVVPTRQRLQPKPIEEQPIEIEVPQKQRRPNRVEINLSDLEPTRGEEVPKNLEIPKVDSVPLLPSPKYLDVPTEAPIPSGTPMIGLKPERGYRPLYIDLQTINYTIPGSSTLFDSNNSLRNNWIDGDLFQYRVGPDSAFTMDGLFRGYYRNDQRIRWSGVEETFGAEGVLRPALVSRTGDWIVSTQAELFLNSRYGTSILSDPDRDVYRTNFDVSTFQLFQMFVEANYEDWTFRFGRSRTPFGRYQSPMFANNMYDAPFIRTEVIQFVETGMFVHYARGPWRVDLALVNGEPDLDTNSSKAVVTRWGVEKETWTAGLSVKFQDGISSEFQKRFNNVYGVDASFALGRFLIYSEGVMDSYGFCVMPRTILNTTRTSSEFAVCIRAKYSRATSRRLEGMGVHVGVCYREDDWLVDLCYGRYSPENIGIESHDLPISRFTFKTAYVAAKNLTIFVEALMENKRLTEGLLSSYNPWAVSFGTQYEF